MTPLASVITPVYQTPPALFEEAYQSLLSQTCGFERVEWVVAVHNMDDDYAESLKRITGEHENIVFLRVEGGNSPSVPRNQCLQNATGEYIFFLDSDDTMTPDCIEKTVHAMRESRADIAVFGCGFLSRETLPAALRNYRPNAPDQEFVVYERGDPRIDSLMAEWGAMLWSRAYRRKFLLRCGICFDEGIRIGEDLLFNIAVTPMAEIICAMPRFKGYFHRLRWGSLLGSEMVPGKAEGEVLRYIEAIGDCGSSELLWYHLSWFAKNALLPGREGTLSPGLRSALEPVCVKLRVVAPRFMWSRERIEGMLGFCAAVLPVSVSPRVCNRHEVLETPISEEEVFSRVIAAAAENIELRTTGTAGVDNPFLGIASDTARPGIAMVDLRWMNPKRHEAHMDSYRRMEMLRGFREGEVRCRVTVFLLGSLRCALSITWDERFISRKGIKRLRDRVCGDMASYAPRLKTIDKLLAYRCMMTPDATAFCFWEKNGMASVTYSRFQAQMDSLAAVIDFSVLPTRRIGIAAPNSYLWVLVCLTALREGMTVVAFDPSLSREEFDHRLRRTRVSLVFLGEAVTKPSGEDVDIRLLSEVSDLIKTGGAPAKPVALSKKEISETDEALILFTSGTTGYGKAAVLTHKSLMASVAYDCVRWEWVERYALCLPFFNASMHHDLLRGLYTGSTLLITSAQLDVMLRDFGAFRPQGVHIVPRILQMLNMLTAEANFAGSNGFLGGAMKTIICSAAPYPEALADDMERMGIFVCNEYGSTEVSGPIAQTHSKRPRRGALIHPIPGVELKTGRNDEILVHSDAVFAGYLDDPAATAKAIDADGWLHTGDTGCLDPEDGALAITGRIKNLITFSNGEHISPEELEDRISRWEDVEECIVFGETNEVIGVRIYPSKRARRLPPDTLRQRLWEAIRILNDNNPAAMRIERLYVSYAPLERNDMGKLIRSFALSGDNQKN